MKSIRSLAALKTLVGLLIWEQSLHAQAEFYNGKTIPMIAGTTAGALYDNLAQCIYQNHGGLGIPCRFS